MDFLDKGGQLIIEKLTSAGFEAYAVGGCVRDSVMARAISDIDITTSATPGQVENCLNGYKIIKTGISFGSVTVLVNSSSYEVTTFRAESCYDNHRHPSNVNFSTSLAEDLKRRDFTMNALAYSQKTGLIDLYGGLSHIKARQIVAVGNALERFCEDALRILRCIRFSAVLGFSVQEQTAKCAIDSAKYLKNISAERKFTELKKLIMGENVFEVLMLFKQVIFQVIPQLSLSDNFCQHTPWHDFDVYTHTAKAVSVSKMQLHVRLALLLHDISKPLCFTLTQGRGHFAGHAQLSAQMAKDILLQLKCDNITINCVLLLIEYHTFKINNSSYNIKLLLNKLGEQLFFNLIDMKIADNLAKKTEQFMQSDKSWVQGEIQQLENAKILARQIIDQRQCYNLKGLAINGQNLLQMGIQGKQVGATLNSVLDLVMQDKLHNSTGEISHFLKNNLKMLGKNN